MKRLVGTLLATLLLFAAGCGGGEDDGGGDSTGRGSSLLSDGVWQRTVTAADAEAAGIGPAEIPALLGADRQMVLELEIDGDRWKQYQTEDDGRRVIGDLGTWSIDDDGNWVTVSDSPGCRGCEGVVALSGTPERLTTQAQGVDDPVVRLIVDGTWERQA